MTLSIVVPCYNEEKAIPRFYEEIIKELKKLQVNYELVFVDDGSSDNTLETLKSLYDKDKKIKIVSFSRNFWKESAMLAGLEKSTGDYVVIMDADLQDPPSMLKEMISILDSGEYDSVATYRVTRKGEPVLRTIGAKIFYKLINKLTKLKIVDGARDYRMMTRRMVDVLLNLKEYHRFSKGLFTWVGFKTKYLEYENIERKEGKSRIHFKRLIKYAFEGIISFTSAPLKVSILIGIFISFIASFYLIYIFIFNATVSRWIFTLFLTFLLGGIQLITLGVIGEYLAYIYDEVRKRPPYIIKEYISNDK